jgi:flagellar protein FlaG
MEVHVMSDRESIARSGEAGSLGAYIKTAATRGPANSLPAVSEPAANAEAPPVAVDPEQLQKLVVEIKKQVQNLQRSLQFSVDEESGATVVKVVDSQTKEVIRQIPAEEMMTMASRLRSAAGGLLLSDTV